MSLSRVVVVVVIVVAAVEVTWYALGGSVSSGAVASVIIDAHGPSLRETFLSVAPRRASCVMTK